METYSAETKEKDGMNIVHMISGGDVGGAKTHVLTLLKGLTETQNVKMICFTEGDFAREAEELGVETVVVGSANLFSAVRKVRGIIGEFHADVLHCHGARANLIGSLVRRKISAPVVTTVHSDYRLDYLGRPLGRLTFGTINTVALRFLDYYIGVSEFMGDLLISRGFDPQRIYALYNGVDFSVQPPQTDRALYLQRLGLNDCEGCVVFGIAARLSAVKDVGTLIKGFGLAAKENPKIRLLIAGDGEQRAELERLAASCCPPGSYVFAGWVSDMNAFYAALDVNTLTSLSETFPYALTEGARMRCATIASRVGGVPYLIEDGVCGLLFEAQDEKKLAAHIQLLARDDALRRKLGDALYEKAKRDFSLDATVRRQIEIYESILLRRRRAARKRDGVLICGAYGRDNAGDDAILTAIVRQMRAIDPELPLYVLTRKPKETGTRYRVGGIYTFDFFGFCRRARKTRLYINGGGSLIQDVTSSRSLWYYLMSIRTAKRYGNAVLMYGCGIGPVERPANRRRAGKVIDRYVDAATLREERSLEELRSMGVTHPKLLVTSDPAILLEPAARGAVEAHLQRHGIGEEEKIVFFALRPWHGLVRRSDAFSAAARELQRKYGLRPVFLAMEPKTDRPVCERAAEELGATVIDAPASSELLIGLLARAELVISVRLHTLIFAAGVGTPLVGVSYDPKVEAFLNYLGRKDCLSLKDLTAEMLTAEAEAVLRKRDEAPKTAKHLRELAQENQSIAKTLLEENA